MKIKKTQSIAQQLAKEFEELMAGKGFSDEALNDHLENHQYILDYLKGRSIKKKRVATMTEELNKLKAFKVLRDAAKPVELSPEPDAA